MTVVGDDRSTRPEPDRLQLFAFSAATWNTHRIHYDRRLRRERGLPRRARAVAPARRVHHARAARRGRPRGRARHPARMAEPRPRRRRRHADLRRAQGRTRPGAEVTYELQERNAEGVVCVTAIATSELCLTRPSGCTARCARSAPSRRRRSGSCSAASSPATCTCSIGQEAVAAGVCDVLRRDDHITTTHRGHGHCVAKGGDVERMFAELLRTRDRLLRRQARARCTSPTPRAASSARPRSSAAASRWPSARRSRRRCSGSDRCGGRVLRRGRGRRGQLPRGAEPRRGVEAAARVRLREQRLRRAHARGRDTCARRCTSSRRPTASPASPVDGNDALAVRAAADAAVARARAGDGPTLLECAHLPLERPLRRRPRAVSHARRRRSRLGAGAIPSCGWRRSSARRGAAGASSAEVEAA